VTATVFIPRDAGALSLGAEATAGATAREAAVRHLDVTIARNGSRGLYWLEPLVEVATPAGRVAYGPVTAADVPGLFDAGFLAGGQHRLGHGPTEQIPWLASQQRLTCSRIGVIAPADVADYAAHGGLAGLRRALTLAPADIVREVSDSGLRGRGGAAFPTGRKWRTVLEQEAPCKYITCNADEGDSGTFADRLLLEGDPLAVIEGMVIAGLAVGAAQGYLYLRIEYPHARRVLGEALAAARAAGLLGDDILGSGRRFDLEVRLGAGAYICGEETSMLESLEGRRGEVRVRPPLPAVRGLFGMPTVVNNVVTFASVPAILAQGAGWYRDYGRGESRGTLPLQLGGNVRRGGLIERAFGVTLRELIEDYGGGTASGRPVRAVQIGGPLGAWLPPSLLDTPVDYEALAAVGAPLGHGGIVVFDDTVDLARMARFAFEFCAQESCGKCTPCRIGSTRGVELMDRIRAGQDVDAGLERLGQLCDTLRQASLCGLGGMTPNPVESALRHFPEDFRGRS
jgi:formate dehydrogenase iron-sulfur subunit